jgi:hypothetical protein
MTSAASSNQAAAADAGGESGQAAQEEDAPHVPVLLEEIMGFWRDRPMQVPQHVIPPTPARTLHLGFGKLRSKAEPRQQQDWVLKFVQGGRDHPLAACGCQ